MIEPHIRQRPSLILNKLPVLYILTYLEYRRNTILPVSTQPDDIPVPYCTVRYFFIADLPMQMLIRI
jgi:hypothetical protein